MSNEIEKKYLVDIKNDNLKIFLSQNKGIKITQGYLDKKQKDIIVLYKNNNKGYIKINLNKNKDTVLSYEYEIPVLDIDSILEIEDKTIRVRKKGNSEGYFTIKGKQVGITRPEYEYKIAVEAVTKILNFCEVKIEKTRYEYNVENNLKWEIDIFEGKNEGLVMAEIELPNEHTDFEKQEWLSTDVSEDFRFSNVNLANESWDKWGTEYLNEKLNKDRFQIIKDMGGSCNCLTKTPDMNYHKDDCNYKILSTKLKKLLTKK